MDIFLSSDQHKLNEPYETFLININILLADSFQLNIRVLIRRFSFLENFK